MVYFPYKKVNESRNRPGVSPKVLGGLGSQISKTFDTWRWWGCQPHEPAAFTTRNVLVLIFSRGWVDPRAMVGSEGNMSLKNPVTQPGIDLGTVRPAAQRLNHYATSDPIFRVHFWLKQTLTLYFKTFPLSDSVSIYAWNLNGWKMFCNFAYGCDSRINRYMEAVSRNCNL
jgi:hypothetical protein